MSPYIINFGLLKLRWYPIILIIAFSIASLLALNEGKRLNINKDKMFDLIFWTVLSAIIGARLYYCLFDFHYFASHPLEILAVYNGGMAIHGGIIGGLLAVLIFAKKNELNFLKLLDIIVVSLIIGQAIGRWGNFFNGEAHGFATSLDTLTSWHLPKFIIDGMLIDGNYYTPLFLVESLICLIGFIILRFAKGIKLLKCGMLTSFYLVWYGFFRFFIESGRTDSLMFLNLKMAQVVSLLMITAGVLLFFFALKKEGLDKLYNTVEGERK